MIIRISTLIILISLVWAADPKPFHPKSLPPEFWEMKPKEAALALAKSAYAARGINTVDLAIASAPAAQPDQLVISRVNMLGNHDQREECLVITTNAQRAWLVETSSSGNYHWNPRVEAIVKVAIVEADAQRFRHLAQTIWHLQFIKQQNQPDLDTTPRDIGFILSGRIELSALGIGDGTEINGGLVDSKHSELPRHLPDIFGQEHIRDLGRWVINNVLTNDELKELAAHGRTATQASVDQLLNPDSPMALPWMTLGHAALAAGVKDYRDLLPALRKRIADAQAGDIYAKGRLLRAEKGFGVELITSAMHRDMAIARMREAADRFEHVNDAAYLATWVQENRLGALWAEKRLRKLGTEHLATAIAARLRPQLDKELARYDHIHRLWEELVSLNPTKATELARMVPVELTRHPLALAAFIRLAPIDPNEREPRIESLCRGIEKGELWSHNLEPYIEALVPFDEPNRYTHPAIEESFMAVVTENRDEKARFPEQCARALVRRGNSKGIAAGLAVAKARIDSGKLQLHRLAGELRFLAEIDFTGGEYQTQARELATKAFIKDSGKKWHDVWFLAWAMELDGVQGPAVWKARKGSIASHLHKAWSGENADTRIPAMLELAIAGPMARNPDPIISSTWKQKWDRDVTQISTQVRESCAKRIAQVALGQGDPNLRPLLQHARGSL